MNNNKTMGSAATDRQIHAFLQAVRDNDEFMQSHALGKIVGAWRADNAAGGVPVYAHPPLPIDFADILASGLQEQIGGNATPHIKRVVAGLEPGARCAVIRQLAITAKADAFVPPPIVRDQRVDSVHMDYDSSDLRRVDDQPHGSKLKGAVAALLGDTHKQIHNGVPNVDRSWPAVAHAQTAEYRGGDDEAYRQMLEYDAERDEPEWQPVLERDKNGHIKFDAFAEGAIVFRGRRYATDDGLVTREFGPRPRGVYAQKNRSGDPRFDTNSRRHYLDTAVPFHGRSL